MHSKNLNLRRIPGLLGLVVVCAGLVFPAASGKKVLTFQDIMRFREIHDPVLSEDGMWLAYNAQPDRGDGEVLVHGLENGKTYAIERGLRPQMSRNALWVAAAVKPRAVDLEKKGKMKPKQGMALLETSSGKLVKYESVQSFAFSEDSRWIGILHHPEEKSPPGKEKPEAVPEKDEETEKKKPEKKGALFVLRSLETGEEVQIPSVLSFAFDPSSLYLAYAVATPDGRGNGVFCVELLEDSLPRIPVAARASGTFAGLSWTKTGSTLAFLESFPEEGSEKAGSFSVGIWDGKRREKKEAVRPEDIPEGWMIPEKNPVSWSRDGERLFVGLKPEAIHQAILASEKKKEDKDITEADLFDVEKILENREVDVWHSDDPFIKTHEKKMWPQAKDMTYLAVYHRKTDAFVPLADQDLPRVVRNENPRAALGFSDVPYRKERTWYGRLEDVFVVDLKTGARKKIVSRLEDRAALSPEGRFVAYYRDGNWYLYDAEEETTRNLTGALPVPFYNEDHDYPGKPPSYGLGGWVEGDRSVLVYDKYDIWEFPTQGGRPVNLTGGEGREKKVTFRVLRTDPEKRFFRRGEKLFLKAYHNREKHSGFYAARVGKPGVERLLEERKKFRFLAKAKDADVWMFTRESFEEFPDIWVAGRDFSHPRKVSNVNPQIQEFAWGKAELVEWHSMDGIPLQGVLIKPAGYEQGKRYPVIVYFYRFFSQRLYEFNQMVVNHRPNLPFYASHGYAIFLPDIRFDVGHPGFAATKCLVPGVQKLIDIGVADPKAIGLHGHSWSGYQTAFVITQTNIFAAAVAGAPVSNMTSAYSGIRWGSGLARQFQYEKGQSRIGGSLWEYPERYIENSPV
ncbi:MAG: prolyl oligopeptidase family serine peptidase, partial [Candidatus Aminicenantales bacterium]